MEWATIISLASFVMTLIILGFNFFSHQKIVGNDLHHLAIDLKSVIKKVDKLDERITDSNTRITILEEKTRNI